jgi:hypothetical protein
MKLQATVYLMFFYYIVVSKNNKENEHLIDIFTSGDLVMVRVLLFRIKNTNNEVHDMKKVSQ